MRLFDLGRKAKVKEFNIPEWIIAKAPWLMEVSDDYINKNIWKPRPEPWIYGEAFVLKFKEEIIFGKTIDVVYCDYKKMKAGDLVILKRSLSEPITPSLILGNEKRFPDLCEVLSFYNLGEYRKNAFNTLCVIKAIIPEPNQAPNIF